MSFALQGVPVDPSDVDVQTDEPGARAIQAAFPDRVVDPVEYVESERIRSYLGRRRRDNRGPAEATRGRDLGATRRRHPPPAVRDLARPRGAVLSLSYEADAYERLGRTERAAPLREHTGDEDNGRTDSRSR